MDHRESCGSWCGDKCDCDVGRVSAQLPEFKGFPKIPRLNRTVIVTEKIDGTNAQIYVGEDGLVLAGSRKRWITPEADNFGFAKWVKEHEDELRVGLGIGTHYGEWWGAGIQRRYGLVEKRFSLFNVSRWTDDVRPACCSVVPTLAIDTRLEIAVDKALQTLRILGSQAAPGFMQPEGIVVFHSASGSLYKVTLENDASHKGDEG